MTDNFTLINHYARRGLYRHIQSIVAKENRDPLYMFWKAWSLLMEGTIQDAMTQLRGLLNRRDTNLSAAAALLFAHNQESLVSEDDVLQLKKKLANDERTAAQQACIQAALFHYHTRHKIKEGLDSARGYAEKAYFKTNPTQSVPATIMLAWIELASKNYEKARDLFQTAINNTGGNDLESHLGMFSYYEETDQVSEALEVIDKIIVTFTWFSPSLTEKARLLLALGDWDQALETAQRALAQDPGDIIAQHIIILYMMAREGNSVEASMNLSDLVKSIDNSEPKNADLYFECARAPLRLSGGNKEVLDQCNVLLERAKTVTDGNGISVGAGTAASRRAAAILGEIAAVKSRLGQTSDAMSMFKTASKEDDNALYGYIGCLLELKKFQEAETQITFREEFLGRNHRCGRLQFLKSILLYRHHGDADGAIKLLDEASANHINEIPQTSAFTTSFFLALAPDFMLDMAEQYFLHCPTEPPGPSEMPSPHLQQIAAISSTLMAKVPGLKGLEMMIAKTKWLMGDADAASLAILRVIEQTPSDSEAHLLRTRILLDQERYREAGEALEQALSVNFAVQSSVSYHLTTALVNEKVGNYEEALRVLNAALNLPGMSVASSTSTSTAAGKRGKGYGRKKKGQGQGQMVDGNAENAVPPFEQASVYIQLARVYGHMGNVAGLSKTIGTAMTAFKGTSEEGRIIITHAELLAKRGEFDDALHALNEVKPNAVHYIKTRAAMADIYMTHRMDRRRAMQCYQDIVRERPSVQTRLMLGDALMRLQEPEKAIKVYEEALTESGNDAQLASKMGHALVVCHDYKKAVEYYTDAIEADPSRVQLQLDLAELHFRLKDYGGAEKVCRAALDTSARNREEAGHKPVKNAEVLMGDLKFIRLLANVKKDAGSIQKSLDELMRARETQNIIYNLVRGEGGEAANLQARIGADIAFEIGLIHVKNDPGNARVFFNEALRLHQQHESAILELARLYKASGEDDACQNQCVILLRINPGHEEASMMLAELMLTKGDFERSTFYFKQLLEKSPCHYSALERLLGLLRRAGQLNEAEHYLKNAKETSPKAAFSPGFLYCSGLYALWSNDKREALRLFNLCRTESGETMIREKAILAMIDTYLTSNDMLESGTEKQSDEGKEETDAARVDAVQSSLVLLKELEPMRKSDLLFLTYKAFAMIKSKNVEDGIGILKGILHSDKDYIPAHYIFAIHNVQLKKTPTARNYLKRIDKAPYDARYHDMYERGWLLLSDLYIQGNKYDLATKILKKALLYNRSCGRAHELLGHVMEKEQAYIDAAQHYEYAFKAMNESSPEVAFKLAFNYLKAHRIVDCVDVCLLVLDRWPDYPRIRKEVLSKAQALLKP